MLSYRLEFHLKASKLYRKWGEVESVGTHSFPPNRLNLDIVSAVVQKQTTPQIPVLAQILMQGVYTLLAL